MWGLALSLPQLGHFGAIWEAWHATPASCRDRLLAATAYCLGTGYDRQLVSLLELVIVGLLIVLAFIAGRLTSEWEFGVRWTEQREIVLVGQGPSRFNNEARRGSRFGAAGESSARQTSG